MKNEVSTEQLQKRLAEVQAEQRQTQAAIAGFDASITASQAAMKAAQARYDLRGDDAVKDEVTEHRSLETLNVYNDSILTKQDLPKYYATFTEELSL